MRDVIVSAFLIGLVPACIRKPFVGMLLFSLLAYMRLQDLTWGFARYQRWSYWIAIATLIGYFVQRKRTPFMVPDARTWIMVALVVISALSMVLATKTSPEEWRAYIEYCKIVGVALFTTGLLRNRERLRILIWVIALSLGFYGVKSALHGLLSGGALEIRQGPGGLIFDRNDFALALCMAIPMLLHLGTSEKRDILRRTVMVMAPLTALTIVFTHSRGGFVALGATALVMIWRSRNRVAGLTVCGLIAVGALLLAPKSYVDRLKTMSDYASDASAMGRIKAWFVAGRMIADNPILGVGFGNFEEYYFDYDPKAEVFFSKGGTEGRVAHNSYLQIWAECGTLAFGLYMLMIGLTLWDTWRIRNAARRRYHSSWIISYANMFEASMLAFVVGGVFLNRAHFDLLYHLVAMEVAFGHIARRAMADESAYPQRAAGRGTLRIDQGTGFARRRSLGGFRNSPALPGRV